MIPWGLVCTAVFATRLQTVNHQITWLQRTLGRRACSSGIVEVDTFGNRLYTDGDILDLVSPGLEDQVKSRLGFERNYSHRPKVSTVGLKPGGRQTDLS
jgi:hypothetical protein